MLLEACQPTGPKFMVKLKTLRAYCAWELVRHFGDVPFGYENQVVTEYVLSSRFEIMDKVLAELKAVEG